MSMLVWNGSRAELVAALAVELETRHGRVERWANVIVTNLFGPDDDRPCVMAPEDDCSATLPCAECPAVK